MEWGMVGGVAPTSMPSLHITTSVDGNEQQPPSGGAESADWATGISIPELNRCGSSLSNYSGRSTPYGSLRRQRPGSSLSALHHSNSSASQQLHELRHAVLQGRLEAVTKLLDAGVCVDQTLRQGWTALMFASSAAQVAVVRLLLQREADPNAHKELFTPLMAACASSVRDPNNNNNTNSTASSITSDFTDSSKVQADDQLVDSSESRLLSVVELLVSHGATVNSTERHRLTPLMFASKGGRPTLVRSLLKAGALPNMQDNKGWSALCWACHGAHGVCTRELLTAAADASLTTTHGQTAAEIARSQHHYKLAEVVEAAALGTPIGPSSLPASSCTLVLPSPPPSRCTDLDMVLAGLELTHLSAIFARHKIDLAGFLRLTAGELAAMGISEVGVQRRLLTAIAEMHRKAWQPTSLAPLSAEPFISLVDATSMLGNVNKHVTFLEATLAFLRQQLESSPASKHLHHNTTNTSITTLISTADQAAASITRLHDTTRYLTSHLRELSQCSTHLPSDLVGSRGPDPPRVWRRAVAAAAAAASLLFAALWGLRPRFLGALFALQPHGDTVLLDY